MLARVCFRNRKSPKAGPNTAPHRAAALRTANTVLINHTSSISKSRGAKRSSRGRMFPEDHISYQHQALPNPSNRTLSPGWCHPAHGTSHLPSIVLTYFTFNAVRTHRAPSPSSRSRSLPGNGSNSIKRKKSHNLMRFGKHKAD